MIDFPDVSTNNFTTWWVDCDRSIGHVLDDWIRLYNLVGGALHFAPNLVDLGSQLVTQLAWMIAVSNSSRIWVNCSPSPAFHDLLWMEKNHNSPSPFVLVFRYFSFHFSFLLELTCSWILCGSFFLFLLHFASRPKLNSSRWKHKFHFLYFFSPFLKGTIIGLILSALCQFVRANCNPYDTFWVPLFFLPFGLQYSFYCQALREMANYSEFCICIYLLLIEYGVVVL